MVNYKHILHKDWRIGRPVNTSSLQWYQSQRFKPWEKPIRNRLENYKMRYSLKNRTAEIVPKSNQKRQLSNEGKNMLNEKLKEIEAFNGSSVCAAFKRKSAKIVTRKEKRARCFICKERGHVLWKCPNKKNKNRGETSKPLFDEKLKYPEVVHVKTDYMVEGSDEQNWNKIWYVGSVYKNHMSPTKSLFKRLKNSFKVLDKEEDEIKFIFSYCVREAIVETKDGALVIPNVYYTPEIIMNVLSTEQLENQGYVMTYDRNRCGIRYMIDNEEGMVDTQQDSVMTCEDSMSMVESHNKPDVAITVGKLRRYTSNSGYTDASWINNIEDNTSTSGWVFMIGGGVISWASKKQTYITGLKMKYEFAALAAGKEAE
uniref:ARID DNA-binding domain-containing protein n=1 Tax=Tanacetum cinerariifolium TaxID=118510 RepID=A0A6L2LIA3_TANCI|nr:ARID DNA-binding domain-containing protein [Tanacetum cinerariifolium]